MHPSPAHADPPPRRRLRTLLRWCFRAMLGAVTGIVLLIGWGTPAEDTQRMRAFADAVLRWQIDPDFRQVQREYVYLGSRATATRVAGVPSARLVLWLRAIPGLPDHLRINEGSTAHYQAFRRGELSAYLHLSSEQGVDWVIDALEPLGPEPSDDELRQFLRGFRMHYAVADDAGAVASMRAVLNEVDPSRPFTVRTSVTEPLLPHIADIAQELGLPPEPAQMNRRQQSVVLERLNAELRGRDAELWRTRQVNDLLNGIWAQVCGRIYREQILPVLRIRAVCRVIGPILLACWAMWLVLRVRNARIRSGPGSSGAMTSAAMNHETTSVPRGPHH